MKNRDLIIDSFAGGGGASLGIERALGRGPDVAINHNPAAIEMHRANHPNTVHLTEDVFKVDPRKATKGKPVGLMWASPDCRHFSRAKGGKPVEKSIRGLAWVVIKWAAEVSPRVIVLENVREFQDWGPLCPRWDCTACAWRGTEGQARLARHGLRACPVCDGRVKQTAHEVPNPAKKGVTFRQFCGRLRGLGYVVETRVLNAADYGAPTHRRRLFLIARNDGKEIVWPDETHGDPKKVGQADLFSEPLKPWRTAAECIDWSIPCPSIFDRKKPLAEKTLKRIAMGVKRYVLDAANPFIVTVNHGKDEFRGRSLHEPFGTVTGSRGDALITPVLAGCGGPSRTGEPRDIGRPLGVVMPKDARILIAPCLYPRNGEREGQSPRCGSVETPLPTVVQTANGAQLVAALITKHYGGMVGVPADTPLPTTTARGTQNQLTVANLVHMNHGAKQWSACDDPMRTVTTGGHAALVYSFLIRYFGTAIGQHLTEPLFTVTGKDRFGLVTVMVGGEPYVIVDIGMRMLRPRELARAQGFGPAYILTGTNTNQVERIGNSVCPDVAEAIIRANCGDLAVKGLAA